MKTGSPSAPTEPSPSVVSAWIHLMRAQRVVLTAIEQDLKEAGLPPLGWYDVLLELSRAEEGRLRPYTLEERTLLAQHNLSRLLDRMERDGLVQRAVLPEDGRGRWVVITAKGRRMRERIWTIYAASIQAHVGDRLTGSGAKRLSVLLALLAGPGLPTGGSG